MKVHDNQSRRSNWQLLKRIQDGGPEEEENSCRSACRVHDSEEVGNLQTDDSVASVTMLFTPGLFRRSFFFFLFPLGPRDNSCRRERGGGREGGKGQAFAPGSGPVPTAVCVCAFCVSTTVRSFLTQNRAVISHGRPGKQLLAVPVPRKLSL